MESVRKATREPFRWRRNAAPGIVGAMGTVARAVLGALIGIGLVWGVLLVFGWRPGLDDMFSAALISVAVVAAVVFTARRKPEQRHKPSR